MFKVHWFHFLIFIILLLIISLSLIYILFPSFLQLPEGEKIPLIPGYPTRTRVLISEFEFTYLANIFILLKE